MFQQIAPVLLALALQQVPPNSAFVVGRVLDRSDDKPISGAVVEIMSLAVANGVESVASNPPRRQTTDSLGRFVFRELPGAVYTVRVTVGGSGFSPNGFIQNGLGFPFGGFVEGGYGQRRPGGPLQPLVVGEGQGLPDLVVRLWRSAAISGTVIDDLGEPVVDTVVGAVQVSSDGRLLNGPTIRTDDRGSYRLSGLLPGRYIVFVPQVTTAMSAESADAAMKRIAELTAAQKPGSPVAVVPELTGIRVGNSLVKTAVAGLIDGNIAPRRDGDALFVFQTTFHPGTVALGAAAPLDLASGDDRLGVDVSLQPVRAASVSGTIMGVGRPASGASVRLVPAGNSADASLFEMAVAQTDSQGRFTFPLVPIGNYTLKALNDASPARPVAGPVLHSDVPGGPGSWLSEPVGVGEEGVKGLTFTLRPGFSMGGQLEFVGATPKPTADVLVKLQVSLRSVQPRARADRSSGGAQAYVSATGAFSLVGVPPGRYVLRFSSVPAGFPWKIQSVFAGAADLAEVPIEISEDMSNVRVIVGDTTAAISGNVTSPDPGDGAFSVLLFPANRALWPDARALSGRFRIARASASGEFAMSNVPSGDYMVVAVADVDTSPWPDSTFMARLFAEAAALHIEPGQHPVLVLTTKAIR